MSEIRVDTFKNESGGGAPNFPNGITGTTATFSGDVGVGGTLTYEDVKNIDSVGIVTANKGIQVSGIVTAKAGAAVTYYGDGSNLTGVVSGIELKQAGSSVGTSLTAINFASGATLTDGFAGLSTITIAAGISTGLYTASGITTHLLLSSSQDHEVKATGNVTIKVTGGKVGESHDIRVVNVGVATVGFGTDFLWPSGATPNLPSANGSISLISFTVHKVGAAGTQLLSGASLNYS